MYAALRRPVGLDAPDRIDRFFVVARLRPESAGGKLAFAEPGGFPLTDQIWKNIWKVSPQAVDRLDDERRSGAARSMASSET
jgi:hypothetical protein